MAGYILGLGDRHPSNLMLERVSGRVVHIDFGDCFEITKQRSKYPEIVPFRLTRMMTVAMGHTGIAGTYRVTCEKVMRVLRDNRDSVMAMLEAFVYDPLISWRLLTRRENETVLDSSVPLSRAVGAWLLPLCVRCPPLPKLSLNPSLVLDILLSHSLTLSQPPPSPLHPLSPPFSLTNTPPQGGMTIAPSSLTSSSSLPSLPSSPPPHPHLRPRVPAGEGGMTSAPSSLTDLKVQVAMSMTLGMVLDDSNLDSNGGNTSALLGDEGTSICMMMTIIIVIIVVIVISSVLFIIVDVAPL